MAIRGSIYAPHEHVGSYVAGDRGIKDRGRRAQLLNATGPDAEDASDHAMRACGRAIPQPDFRGGCQILGASGVYTLRVLVALEHEVRELLQLGLQHRRNY